jgi:hypothetical protein
MRQLIQIQWATGHIAAAGADSQEGEAVIVDVVATMNQTVINTSMTNMTEGAGLDQGLEAEVDQGVEVVDQGVGAADRGVGVVDQGAEVVVRVGVVVLAVNQEGMILYLCKVGTKKYNK